MKTYIQNGIAVLAVVAVSCGLIVGIVTWNTNKGVQTYFKVVSCMFKPVTMFVENIFTKALEPQK